MWRVASAVTIARVSGKYWYSAPTDTPAACAMEVVDRPSAPPAISRSAASSTRATSSRLRCCWGVRRVVAIGGMGRGRETVSDSSYFRNRVLEREREEVAATARRLAADGLVAGTSGNVTARARAGVAVTPTGAVLAELDAASVPVVALDGVVVEGDLAPPSEVALPLGVYRRYDTGAVVHTHAPMAT